MDKPRPRRADLLYPDLSYKINGALFDVFKKLGPGYQERYYQRAVASALTENNISFQEQLPVPLFYNNKPIGRYVLDFLIGGAVVLEIKKGNYFKKQNIEQVLGYLKSKNLKLGLIANFTSKGARIKRIVNIS
jgi:GxxExxY protein